MRLTLLGGDTGSAGSPRLYQVEDGEHAGDFVVQGYLVEDSGSLATLRVPEGETAVRVPQSLWAYLPEEFRGNPQR